MPKNTDKRILLWDIEATNLEADFGYIICVAWKWLGESRVYHVSIADSPTFKKDPTNDKWVVEQFLKILEQADVQVFHYGSRFDYPFLKTRALYHGNDKVPRVPYIDTWAIARRHLKLHSNRLASIASHFQLPEKTPLSGPIWLRAMSGHGPSIAYVVKHCRQDIVVLEEVYKKISPLRVNPPAKPIEESFYSVKQTKRGFSARKVGL